MAKIFGWRWFWKATLFLLLLFVLANALFYIFSDQVIFQSTKLDKGYQFDFKQPYKEYFITTPDSTSINAIRFSPPKTSKGLVFYLHGNADDLSRWGNYAVDFTRLGYDVVMFDYRGYGKSTHTPDHDHLAQDALFLYKWFTARFAFPKVIVYGRSLGAALASELASQTSPDLLILETPFAEFEDVVYWPLHPTLYWLPHDEGFSNVAFLPKVKCRKIIFHGTDDWVVPLSSAQKLAPLLDHPEDFVFIEGGGHKNLREFELYHTKLAEILN
ncbi:MAG: lysophospholipase [Cyclobacteriaceae bacterium]|nr:alpha/beta fold hydrolase [Cyclobacteriaceae bacterium]MCB9236415.1 alpha/beta fold hydrolase [Flammeovirgaceae bacterium]MCB0499337.1 alpha/beta fold hydrolase [Cyclobacteriaceae bacterium]MCO5272266.1 lysophospholipase [Cyclobacteriaceae bacterium]MCW5902124.1 alpha/beta fold hydrolase [Cyclobacteriaceae bacterium]